MLHMRVFEPDAKVFIIFKEWPMFYAYLIIDGVFKGINDQVEKYQKFLKRRLIYTDKGGENFGLSFYLSHRCPKNNV